MEFKMTEATYQQQLEFAKTVLIVMRQRLDLESHIMAAHRDLIGRTSRNDPHVCNCNLTNALVDIDAFDLTDPQQAALLELLQATLHGWFNVSLEFKSWIAREFILRATLRGDDQFEADLAFDSIVSAARSYGEIHSESVARVAAERLKRQHHRDALDVRQARAGRQLETRRGGSVI
jgi:hypothetical protein